MYVCMCVGVCMCVNVYVLICVCVCVYVCMYNTFYVYKTEIRDKTSYANAKIGKMAKM